MQSSAARTLPRLAGLVAAAALLLPVRSARAQVAGGASVAPIQQPYPERWLNYGQPNQQDLGVSTRPINMNPYGISYDDCIKDMTLVFSVYLSGFTGSQNLQIWATKSGDCTSTMARGIGLMPTCWQLPGGFTEQVITGTQQYAIRVQDIVGPQNLTNPDGSALTATYHRWGPEACGEQQTFAAVPITLWFLPLDNTGAVAGMAFSTNPPISTDMVGPPAPVGVSTSAGDSLMIVNWVANSDSDTAGYDVFIDPPPGVTPMYTPPPPVLYCPPGSADASTGGASASDAAATGDAATGDAATGDAATGDAMTVDASDASSAPAVASDASSAPAVQSDAGCFYVNVNGGSVAQTGANQCTSSALQNGVVTLEGGTTTSTPQFDDAGNLLDSGTITSGGGRSNISCTYVLGGVGSDCNAGGGQTITGEPNSSYTITGLENGATYNVVVAAVDATGNVGPASPLTCDYPAPVKDFWKIYRDAGGKAGGGFCALETLGAPAGSAVAFGSLGALLAAILRRRRRAT